MTSLNHVTGRTRYVADLRNHRCLHAKFVRLATPRAQIVEIDRSEAVETPGVVAVFTANDLVIDGQVPTFGPLVADQPVLAHGETKYEGEPVAIVVATSERVAHEGVRRVRVRSTPLDPVMTRDDALTSPPIHSIRPESKLEWAGTNIMGEWQFIGGDVSAAAAKAPVIIENTYTVPFAHHFAMELYGAIAFPEGDGVAVVTATQHPFIMQRIIAATLGLPQEAVRIQATELGGSFGSKGYPKVEPAAALLALRLGVPVRIMLTAEESFLTGQREAAQVYMRSGFDATGQILFHEVQADFLVGAYTDISERVVCKAGLHALTPYRTNTFNVFVRGLFTNTPPTTAFRGFGAPHVIFALESQMNQAADQLHLDPVDLRLRNLRDKGESVPGESSVDGDWKALLTSVADVIGMDTANAGRDEGRGIALGLKSCIPATTSTARVLLSNEGKVTAFVGTTEMGQGIHATLAKIVADSLGVTTADVTVVAADTADVPFDALTASSRSTVHMGNALLAACDHIREQMKSFAWSEQGMRHPIEVSGTTVKCGHETIALSTLMESRGDAAERHVLAGEGTFCAAEDPEHPMNGPTPFYEVVVTAVRLRVDRETGMISIQKIVHGTDAGQVLNPRRATGLDDGGVVMGLGLAMSEQLLLDEGTQKFMNGSSLDYRIPTVAEIPPITSVFIENRDGPGPHGSKGIAEGGILAVAPALSAAVTDATGVVITRLPLTPETIWSALANLPDGK